MALEYKMNCFNWHNYSSDYLDGTLQDPIRSEAEKHLESCSECKDHFKHYSLIISALSAQPRAQLPPLIRKAPLAAVMSKLETTRISLSHWERIPWYLRVTGEAIGIVALVLFCISSSPRIRSIYEKNVEHNMNDFKESLNINEVIGEGFEPGLLTPEKALGFGPNYSVTSPQSLENKEKPDGQFEGESDEINGEIESSHSSVHAGESQLWRFTLKTVSPDELRPQVIKALQELSIPATTRGIAGTQVPGGIEFDLILPQTIIPNIKSALEKVIPGAVGNKDYPVGSEIFSWYKVKSRKKLPKGMSKVVIWLSQPN
jgi:hypothetical protein